MMNNTREQAIADLKRIIIAVKATDLESLINKNSIKVANVETTALTQF